MTAAPHTGMGGQPCQCTPWRRRKMMRYRPLLCRCHGSRHADCPDAEPCLGDCGRNTTASETNVAGYCPHCAADARWVKVA